MKHFSRIIVLALIVSSGFISCKENLTDTDKNKSADSAGKSLNLYGSIDDNTLKNTIISAFQDGSLKADSIKIKRCPCDEKLLKVTLPDGFSFIKGHDGEVIVKNDKTKGQEDLNFGDIVAEIDKPISTLDDSESRIGNNRNKMSGTYSFTLDNEPTSIERYPRINSNDTSPAIKVAIFDSGLDNSVIGLWSNQIKSTTKYCGIDSIRSELGWDFIKNKPNTIDDQKVKHGSRVAHLLSLQFNESDFSVKIIPYKILDKNNQGSLFDLLCAMENARQNDIQLFNMSLGYYGSKDSIFSVMIDRVTAQGIPIVTAAGNQVSDNESNRNLNTMPTKFYPAWYAKTNQKVFAVTTYSKDCNACERQNYGGDFVFGVEHQGQAKREFDCRFKFGVRGGYKVPGNQEDNVTYVFGTSYAAPIFSGWLAKTYGDELRSINSTTLIQRNSIALCTTDTSVRGYIKPY